LQGLVRGHAAALRAARARPARRQRGLRPLLVRGARAGDARAARRPGRVRLLRRVPPPSPRAARVRRVPRAHGRALRRRRRDAGPEPRRLPPPPLSPRLLGGTRGNPRLRAADRYLGIPLVAAAGALKRPRPWPEDVRRIGVLNATSIGDTVVLSPVVRDIAAAFPEA